MAKFRKKPVVIEARQFTKEACKSICVWVGLAHPELLMGCASEGLTIPTLEGDHLANPGDWIICGIKGEFYSCRPDIFEATYEPAD